MTSNIAFRGRGFDPAMLKRPARPQRDLLDPEICGNGVGSQQIRALKTGESLFLQGDQVRSVCILREGWAFRYQSLEDGRRQIVDFVLPGDILGVGTLSQMPYGVEALSTCTWVTMSRESFLAKLAQEPSLGMKMIDMLSGGQVRAFEQITSVGRRTARERVAHLLLDLAKRVQRRAADCEGVEITMPLMLSHLGDALGLATETVCRCLGELKRAGFLVFSAGRLEILDLVGLSDLVGSRVDDAESEEGHDRRMVA